MTISQKQSLMPVATPEGMRENIKKRIQEQSYKRGDSSFTLSNGTKSADFFDMKQVLMDPIVLASLSNYIRAICIPHLFEENKLPHVIGGPMFGAVPLTMALCSDYFRENEEIFPVLVRKERKDHGTAQEVEFCQRSTTTLEMLVLDDVITSGNSLIKSIRTLREFGFKIDACLVLMDRQEGGAEKISKEGIKFHALFSADEFRKDAI